MHFLTFDRTRYGWRIKADDGRDFDALINEFEYYNCTSETGRYTAFYLMEV